MFRRRQVVMSVCWLLRKPFFLRSLLAHLLRLDEISLLGNIIRVLGHILQHAYVFRIALIEINEIFILKARGTFIDRVLVGSRGLRLDIRYITGKSHCHILTVVVCPIIRSLLVLQRNFRDAIWYFLEFIIGLAFVILFLNGIQRSQSVDIVSIKVILFLFNCRIGIKVHNLVLSTFGFLGGINKFNRLETRFRLKSAFVFLESSLIRECNTHGCGCAHRAWNYFILSIFNQPVPFTCFVE